MAGFIAPIAGALGGLFDGIFGGPKQTTTTNQTTNQNQSGTSTSTPNLSPLQQGVVNNFLNSANSGLTQSGTQANEMTGQQLQTNNNTYDAQNRVLQNTLAARGLTYSPVAASGTTAIKLAGAGANAATLGNAPILKQQLYNSNLSNIINAFRASPFGTTTDSSSTGTSNTEGTSTVQSKQNPFSAALQGFIGGGGVGSIGKLFGA